MKQEKTFNRTYWVQEVFPTIQGEGPYTGTPAVFVRLAGCNLRCHFCDTDFTSSDWLPTLLDLLVAINSAARGTLKLVVITGGEPMRQPLWPLVHALLNARYAVQIETAGVIWDSSLDSLADLCIYPNTAHENNLTIVCSPKTGLINMTVQRWCRHYKYIVNAEPGNASAHDGLPMHSTQDKGRMQPVWRPQHDARATIWVQPEAAYIDGDITRVDHVTSARNTQHAIHLCMTYGYRMSLQTHRILGLP